MKERFWKLFAAFVIIPCVTEWLIKQSLKRPYKHIGKYMLRHWLIDRKYKIIIFGKLIFTIVNNFICVRIHHINRHDLDPFVHDHPGSWRTFPLKGWYVEEDALGNKHLRKPGDTAFRDAFDPHRIDEVAPEGVVTLFIMYRRRNDWGFYVNEEGKPARKVPHEKYQSKFGRAE